MGLIDCMSRNPAGLTIPLSEYDEEFVVASIRTFINNLKMIDNVILKNLANQNKVPCELIKKRAQNKGLLNAASNIQLTTEHSKLSAIGHFQTNNRNQLHSKHAKNSQLSLFQLKIQQYQTDSYQTSCKNSVPTIFKKRK